MADYKVVVSYSDGTIRTLQTPDGKRAMQEAASGLYEESIAKTVTLEKDGEAIWREKVRAYEPVAEPGNVVR